MIERQATKQCVASISRDDDPVSNQVAEEGAGFVEPIDVNDGAEEQIENGGDGAPVLVGVDHPIDEISMRDEAVAEQPARRCWFAGHDGDVGGDGQRLGGDGATAGSVPVEEGADEDGVGAEMEEGPDEVVGAKSGGEGAEYDVWGLGAALLEGGDDAADELRVIDGGLLGGVIREGADGGGDEVDGKGVALARQLTAVREEEVAFWPRSCGVPEHERVCSSGPLPLHSLSLSLPREVRTDQLACGLLTKWAEKIDWAQLGRRSNQFCTFMGYDPSKVDG